MLRFLRSLHEEKIKYLFNELSAVFSFASCHPPWSLRVLLFNESMESRVYNIHNLYQFKQAVRFGVQLLYTRARFHAEEDLVYLFIAMMTKAHYYLYTRKISFDEMMGVARRAILATHSMDFELPPVYLFGNGDVVELQFMEDFTIEEDPDVFMGDMEI